jgi:hypothetical protein
VKELVRYLHENLFIDFQGAIAIDHVREFLRKDDSREARALLTKLNADGDISDMLDTLADTLKTALPRGLNDQVVREQLVEYAES